MDILKINALDHEYVQNVENQLHRRKSCILMGMWNVEKRITEIKFTINISFLEARKIVEQTQEQPSYAYVTKKEMRKRKIQKKNWTNWFMN